MVDVLILEADPMARKLLEIFVTSFDGYHLIPSPEYSTAESLFCGIIHANLILMDVTTATQAGGRNFLVALREHFPGVRIILMLHPNEACVIPAAKETGLESVWFKEANSESLRNVMDDTVAENSVYPDSCPVIRLGDAPSSDFTERELQILKELVDGHTNIFIAEKLNLSIFTVKQHIQKMLQKTGFTNRTELAVQAINSRIVIADLRKEELY